MNPFQSWLIWTVGIALAPLTGGISVAITAPLVVTQAVVTVTAQAVTESYATQVQHSRIQEFLDHTVVRVEYRICHLFGTFSDFGLTVANRLLTLDSTKAAHHHFLIMYLENETMIYVDKEQNIVFRQVFNTNGRVNGKDKGSAIYKQCANIK